MAAGDLVPWDDTTPSLLGASSVAATYEAPTGTFGDLPAALTFTAQAETEAEGGEDLRPLRIRERLAYDGRTALEAVQRLLGHGASLHGDYFIAASSHTRTQP